MDKLNCHCGTKKDEVKNFVNNHVGKILNFTMKIIFMIIGVMMIFIHLIRMMKIN